MQIATRRGSHFVTNDFETVYEPYHGIEFEDTHSGGVIFVPWASVDHIALVPDQADQPRWEGSE